MLWAIISLVVSALAIGVAAYFYKWVQALPVEEEKIRNIGELIRNGAFTFLKREYRILAIFVAGISTGFINLSFTHMEGQRWRKHTCCCYIHCRSSFVRSGRICWHQRSHPG